MYDYVPPIDDYRFLLQRVLRFDDAMAELSVDVETDLAVAILEEAGKFCAGVLHPINRQGDEVGSRLIDGEVVTPPGFVDAYHQFRDNGWTSLGGDPAFNGQGLPFLLQMWFDEMISATNVAFGLFPGLSRGATEALRAHASDDLKANYLARLVQGEWTGAMALTEGGAGTDLALLKAKAAPREDGTYAVTGEKIFISSGDHDFGGNVVHLVLARLPDAPAGVKGISLFLVPKYLPGENGEHDVRNTMSVGALEAKMGIHAQPTCLMRYDGAIGWLVGQPHRGLAAMFTMMNAERLMVGMQGLGIAGGAYQQAVHYAQERLQGRSADGTRSPVAIIEHADVRRMLLNCRAFVEGGRALAGWVAIQFERSERHPDAQERAKADSIVALLTPVVKAAFTDLGFESAIQAQQVFGGNGYIREWGMEQFVRDARIAQIYEGTNGVQAMDLVGRKLAMAGGQTVTDFLALLEEEVKVAGRVPQAEHTARSTLAALDLLKSATRSLQGADSADQGASATDYLSLFALVCLGWMWSIMAAATQGDEAPLAQRKRKLARHFTDRILSKAPSHAAGIAAGGTSLMAFENDDFTI